MSDTHPLVIVIFCLLFGLAVWSHFHEKPKAIAPVPEPDRAYRRRTDPVWKDRGTL